ncbi:short-chain dehydrogenase [Variovorax sp. CCNWLW235]|uniref:short-chain dehydrogenase n=1 Tax=Variovorax sp. CCNWLW235 TaxID=3127463 RepID=UPI003076CE94
MRLTTSHRRPATRIMVSEPKPRSALVQAVTRSFGAMTGQRQREVERARERFEKLDFDQRVREIGEW